MVHWAPLGEVAGVSVGLSALRKTAEAGGTSLPLVSIGDLQNGTIPALEELPRAEVNVNPSSFTIAAGDVLLTSRGTQIKIALVESQSAGAVASSTLMIIRPGPRLRPEVLYAIVRGTSFREALLRVVRGSTSSFGLSRSDVQKILVPIPPIEEQNEFAPRLAEAERHYRLALQVAEHRRRLLHQATEMWLYPPPHARRMHQDG